MKYVGGKSRIAKEIAAVIKPTGFWWDAFCGGLSVSSALTSYHREGLVSDLNVPLISLYQAIRGGWTPPESITSQLYHSAKTLPDTDPLKAFMGFACSHSAKWFGGFYGPRLEGPTASHPKGMRQDPVNGAMKSIKRDLILLAQCSVESIDFFGIEPQRGLFECIYLDPPYAGTEEYKGNAVRFDSTLLWKQALRWSPFSRVFVSELESPLAQAEVVWEKVCEKRLGSKGQENGKIRERLFYITS